MILSGLNLKVRMLTNKKALQTILIIEIYKKIMLQCLKNLLEIVLSIELTQ